LQYGHWKSLTSITQIFADGDPWMRLESAVLESESVSAPATATGDPAAVGVSLAA